MAVLSAAAGDEERKSLRDELTLPILLIDRIRKSASEAESSKQECIEIVRQSEKISRMLGAVVHLTSSAQPHSFYDLPIRGNVADVSGNLDRALALICLFNQECIKIVEGASHGWVCGLFVYISLYGNSIAYTITAVISMRAIQKSNCYHREGHKASCEYRDTVYMAIFGAVQIVMSQIPEFHNMDWLSVVAATMSFTYSFIGLGLGLANTIENGVVKGSINGISASAVEKVWLVAQALGDIAFAYPYSLILFEIQDTLKSPPPESNTMKKASGIALSSTTLFYLLCGGFGYAAFGDDTPGNLLTGFGFYEPYWLIDLANACIALHLVGGYQIYNQPLFASVDRWIRTRFPNSMFINNEYNLKFPLLPSLRLNLFRLCFRTLYVVSSTRIAMVFPYFNQVIGVIGAVNFWPLAIYFPLKMYLIQRQIEVWSKQWIALQAFSSACLVVTLFAFTGSMEGIIAEKLS